MEVEVRGRLVSGMRGREEEDAALYGDTIKTSTQPTLPASTSHTIHPTAVPYSSTPYGPYLVDGYFVALAPGYGDARVHVVDLRGA